MKIAYFGNDSDFSSIIFQELLKHKNNIDIILAVNTTIKRNMFVKRLFLCIVKFIFNPFDRCSTSMNFKYFDSYLPKDILYYKTTKINETKFVEKIKTLDIDYAIVAGCGVIFKQNLINAFKNGVINYHNSLLPKYKGLGGESMPLYFNEKEFGYTFHYMDSKIDEGNILLNKQILSSGNISYNHNTLLKTFKDTIPILLNKLTKNDKGIPQDKIDSYFGKKEIQEIQTIDNIDDHTVNDLNKLIQIFGHFIYKDKKITKINSEKSILRINYLPISLYKLIER